MPERPSNVSRLISMRNLLAAGGAALVILIVILFYLFRFTVKNAVSASRQLDGKIRGLIPFEKKTAGKGKERKKTGSASVLPAGQHEFRGGQP